MTINKIFLFFLVLSSVGCTREKEIAFDDTLSGQVRQLELRSDNFYDCDHKQHPMKLEMAEAIESNSELITDFAKNPYASGVGQTQFHYIEEFGPTKVWKTNRIFQHTTEWVSRIQSWEKLYERFKEITESEATDPWIDLNKEFRFLLSNDQWRILGGANLLLDVNSKLDLETMVSKLDVCLAKKDCKVDIFSEAETYLLTNHKSYSQYYDVLSNGSFQEFAVVGLKVQISGDLKRYSFNKYSRAKRLKQNKLEIPISTQDFALAQEPFASVVQSFWNRHGFEISIKWIDAFENNIYKILYYNLPGGRASVGDFTMYLYPNPMDSAVAHEFGHILGFGDMYYVVWRPETCDYDQKTDRGDIMSDAEYGAVLQSHIGTLKSQYPLE